MIIQFHNPKVHMAPVADDGTVLAFVDSVSPNQFQTMLTPQAVKDLRGACDEILAARHGTPHLPEGVKS